MPEIAKFEEKILNFSADVELTKEIIRKFDEDMMNKCDKLQLKAIQDTVDTWFKNIEGLENMAMVC